MTSALRLSGAQLARLAPFFAAALLSACAPIGQEGSLDFATGEIGKSFGIQAPRRVYACPRPIPNSLDNCVVRASGYFTVDNAAQQPSDHRTILHIVFEDGRSGWLGYDDFLRQRPILASTGHVARLGMTAEEIKAGWGAPASVTPQPSPMGVREKWTYPGIGELYFENGKLVELGLSRALAQTR